MDDLVGVRIAQGADGGVLIVQRRSEALETIAALDRNAPPDGTGRRGLLFYDVVGNPVFVDLDKTTMAGLTEMPGGDVLRALLAPIPPGFDLAALVPEALQKPAVVEGVKTPSAADEDPIEAFMSNWGR